MKKIILSLILAISLTSAFAQKSNITKAKNKGLYENPDFTGARAAIKLALNDSTTKNLAETWFVAGKIACKENESLYLKAISSQSFDADVKGKAILESYDYYLKALKFDSMPDAKGKVKFKYSKEIKADIKSFYTIQQNLISYGAYLFENKKFSDAVSVFEIYLGIPKLPLMKNELKIDSTYLKINYFTGIAATNAGLSDKAIQYYSELKDKNYESLSVYRLLYDEYSKVKDTVNCVKIAKDGFEKFPKEGLFLQNLINHYIFSGKTDEALVYLNSAIEREPNKAEYHYVKGNLDEATGKIDLALNSFSKAIELDSTIAEAYLGKGRLYYNMAVKLSEKAEEIKDVKKFNAEMKNVDEAFKKAIPFFEKVIKLQPNSRDYKLTLKTMYYRLKKDAVYEAKYVAIVKDLEDTK